MGSAFRVNAEGEAEGLAIGELDLDSELADFELVLVGDEAEPGVLAQPLSTSEPTKSNPVAPRMLRTLFLLPDFIRPVY